MITGRASAGEVLWGTDSERGTVRTGLETVAEIRIGMSAPDGPIRRAFLASDAVAVFAPVRAHRTVRPLRVAITGLRRIAITSLRAGIADSRARPSAT